MLTELQQYKAVFPIPGKLVGVEFLTSAFSAVKYPLLAYAFADLPVADRPITVHKAAWLDMVDSNSAQTNMFELAELPRKLKEQSESYVNGGLPYGFTAQDFRSEQAVSPKLFAQILYDRLLQEHNEQNVLVCHNWFGFFKPFIVRLFQVFELPTQFLDQLQFYDTALMFKAAMNDTLPKPGEPYWQYVDRTVKVKAKGKYNLEAAATFLQISRRDRSNIVASNLVLLSDMVDKLRIL